MAGRKYHWKHGWIPLDDYARRKKNGGHGLGGDAPANAPVSNADLPRASHVVVTHDAGHNSFDIKDKQTGANLSISTQRADELQASGKQIEGIDRRSNLRTGPVGGGSPQLSSVGAPKEVSAHEVQSGDVLQMKSALGSGTKRYTIEKVHAPKSDGIVNIDAKTEAGRTVQLSLDPTRKYTVERKKRKGLPSRDSSNITGMGFGL